MFLIIDLYVVSSICVRNFSYDGPVDLVRNYRLLVITGDVINGLYRILNT